MKFGPPDCREEQAAFLSAQAEYDALQQETQSLLQEIQNLMEKNNSIVQQMQKNLGSNLATFLLGLPLGETGVLGEIIQRAFGDLISDEILKKADALAKELNAVRKKIEEKNIGWLLLFLNCQRLQISSKRQDKPWKNVSMVNRKIDDFYICS